jgi:hypothetical protein
VKLTIPALIAVALLTTTGLSTQAFANNDEDNQIAECVDDNSDAGQSEDVLTAYCQCASAATGNFGVAISDWEKTHADQQEACSKEAGWKY